MDKLPEYVANHPWLVAIAAVALVVVVVYEIMARRDDFASIPGASFAPATSSMPRAEDVLGLAVLRVARDRVVAADALEPMYLRAPDAEINWQTRNGAA